MVVWSCLKLLLKEDLKPILSLYASKNSSRVLKASQRVGYGGDAEIQEDSTISNYDFWVW